MKRAIQAKLHSQSGASLLIALLFFLAALTVGAVVLTAAATNAGRLARNRQNQQNYLAVSSAAQLVKEDIQKSGFTAGYKKVVVETTVLETNEEGEVVDSRVEISEPVYSELPGELTGGRLLQEQPAAGLTALYYSTVPELGKTAPTDMRYDLHFTAEGLPEVSGALTVDMSDSARYKLTVQLYIQKEDGTESHAVTLTFAPNVKSDERTAVSSEGLTATRTTTCSISAGWYEPVITKGAAI